MVRRDLALRRGRVAEAENEARFVLDLAGDDVNMITGGAVEALVRAIAERGAFGEARELLRERAFDGDIGARIWEIGILYSRARLALLEGNFELALIDALGVGELREGQGRSNPTWAAWRSTAALALAHLGRRDEAIVLAESELALAEAFGAPVPIVAALHARMVAESDAPTRIALAGRALAVADGSPALLEAARVRLELGTTLRREGSASRPAWPCSARWARPTPSAPRCSPSRPAASSSPRACARGARRSRARAPSRRASARCASSPPRGRQPRDRTAAVPQRQDRRDASRRVLPQARRRGP